ncbi:sigma-70 family RNA polymerase sigma factor [Rhabdothermincola salaria]|uniref:sigma-70 family RNA polymerase sigma factor n=1 Tax=Rhabdothermincola salaria TaxID=2903142 RepID=UPI001E58964F|nr:sigma-70 family RNA polymerase sigma factor [Rhabdothermincola salaria]MCD9624046.1 sigma-70 family RNA polymerase sigma factor [Rhabdothermincola salaria]
MGLDADDLTEHLDTIYRYALGVTRDPDLAADVAQDTVVRALERGGQYRSDAPLAHWLIRIAHNLIIDRARRADREVLVEVVEQDWRDDSYTVDAAAVVERAATRAELLDALARVPFIYRSAVLLHDVEGLRVIDIAEITGVSLPAAKQRLRRGRMALVSALAAGHQRRLALEGVPMPCWDARQHVSDYLDGDLDADTATLVATHLAVCPTCPPLYAALVGVNGELGRLRDPDSVIAPAVEARIRAAVTASGSGGPAG